MLRFAAMLQLHGKTATGIEVPPDVIAGLGGGKRPAVTVTFNGYSYATTIGVMGGRCLIPVSAEHRTNAGAAAGERLTVDIDLDAAPRAIELPRDFADALDAVAGGREAFDRLAPSLRKEHVRAIEDAKTEATRQRRIIKAIEKLTTHR